jgi:hypothetical protein
MDGEDLGIQFGTRICGCIGGSFIILVIPTECIFPWFIHLVQLSMDNALVINYFVRKTCGLV